MTGEKFSLMQYSIYLKMKGKIGPKWETLLILNKKEDGESKISQISVYITLIALL